MLNNFLGTIVGGLLDPAEYVPVYVGMALVFGVLAVLIWKNWRPCADSDLKAEPNSVV